MLIYHSNGWYEYRTFNGNVFANTFGGIKETVKTMYNIDVYSLLN